MSYKLSSTGKAVSIIVIVILAVGAYSLYAIKVEPIKYVKSFEECVAAGYPVMESFPRQCKTPDGRTYTEEIEVLPLYVNASDDLIQIETPTPGSVTGKEFTIIGKARGTWFFEASFPIELIDENGQSLFVTHADAESDWMTQDFVSFKAVIKTPKSYIGAAVLILKKDNPSGIAEKDASMAFPITIEY